MLSIVAWSREAYFDFTLISRSDSDITLILQASRMMLDGS